MKNILYFLALAALSLSSCRKPSVDEDQGCIERLVIPPSQPVVNAQEAAVIDRLFRKNGIDKTSYRYYRFVHEPKFQTYFPPYEVYDAKYVHVNEYTNGLRVFTAYVGFRFKNDTLEYQFGHPTKGTSVDTKPQIGLGILRNNFLDDVKTLSHFPSNPVASCLEAEFGYYDINSGQSYTEEKLIKGWRVNIKGQEYPWGYYQDKDGSRISFDDGIRTLQ